MVSEVVVSFKFIIMIFDYSLQIETARLQIETHFLLDLDVQRCGVDLQQRGLHLWQCWNIIVPIYVSRYAYFGLFTLVGKILIQQTKWPNCIYFYQSAVSIWDYV